MLNREFVGRGLLRGMLLIPYVISAVAAVLRLALALPQRLRRDRRAAPRPWASPTGRSIFLDNIDRVLPSLIVVNVWKEFPFAMIMLLAGLQTVPDQLLPGGDGSTAPAPGTASGTSPCRI